MYDNINDTYDTAKMIIDFSTSGDAEKFVLQKIDEGLELEKWYAYLSRIYMVSCKFEEALDAALKSVKYNAKYIYGIARLAYIYAYLSDNKNAKKYAMKIFKKCDDNYIILRILILVFAHLDMVKERDILFDKLTKINSDAPDYYYSLALVYRDLEEVDMTLKSLFIAEKKGYRGRYNLYYFIMESFFDKENYKKAFSYAKKALQIYDADFELYKTMAETCAMLQKDADAIKFMKKAVELLGYEKNTIYEEDIIYNELAIFLSEKACYSKALEYINQSIFLNNKDSYYWRKCDILEDMGKPEVAIEVCKKAIELYPSDSDFYTKCSYLYTIINDYNKALKYANIAIAVNPDDSYAYRMKGFCLLHFGQYSQAVELFNRVIQKEPQDSEIFANICQCYLCIEDSKKLLEYANRGLMLDKDNPCFWYNKGCAFMMMRKPKKAIGPFLKAIELDNMNPYNYVVAAHCYSELGMWYECLNCSNQAIFIDKNIAGAFYLKGCALQNMNRPKEAKKMFDKADNLSSI